MTIDAVTARRIGSPEPLSRDDVRALRRKGYAVVVAQP